MGYDVDIFQKSQCSGFFGGISYNPGFFKPLTIIDKYDTKAINAGASLFLFNHMYVYAFAYDLKYFYGGIVYKVYLKN